VIGAEALLVTRQSHIGSLNVSTWPDAFQIAGA
jgi:hypothetical protein